VTAVKESQSNSTRPRSRDVKDSASELQRKMRRATTPGNPRARAMQIDGIIIFQKWHPDFPKPKRLGAIPMERGTVRESISASYVPTPPLLKPSHCGVMQGDLLLNFAGSTSRRWEVDAELGHSTSDSNIRAACIPSIGNVNRFLFNERYSLSGSIISYSSECAHGICGPSASSGPDSTHYDRGLCHLRLIFT
jgi:hypothetical protein